MDALEISGSYWSHQRWKTFTSARFPEFDICRDVAAESAFDFVFAEQVLEHVVQPERALKNVLTMLKPGGYFLPTLPFMIKVHGVPDVSRWTPYGLKLFLIRAGFSPDSIQVDSWGNRQCVVANFDEWAEYDPHRHSLENEPEFPVSVWALARKPV